jgi:nicotinate-nucleotide adenylyltransferase
MAENKTHTRIGILGGTFNPVHTGHLVLAQDALERFELNRVIFVPCACPPHKSVTSLLPAEHRLRMLKLAVKGDPRFDVSDIELKRGGISYTIDTIRALKRRYPEAMLHLIMGADALMELYLWKDVYALLEACVIIVMMRPGTAERITPEALRLTPPWPQRLLRNLAQGHMVEISATDIRRRVAEGQSIRYLVPLAVEMYIAEHKLYVHNR